MFTFQNLEIYKLSKELVVEIYNITKHYPNSELYGLVSQMNRAVISIPANIAEGYGRANPKDRNHFINIAKGSLFELVCHLDISCELNLITNNTHNQQLTKCNSLSVRLANFSKYLIK